MTHGECRTMQNDKMRFDSKPRLVFVISLLLCLGSKYHHGVQSFVLNREVVNTVRFYNNDALHAASKQPWQQTECRTSRIESTRLHSISEWRDKMFDYLPGSSTDRRLGSELAIAPPKEICVLPFPFQDVLVQGETKQLRLYEDRFIKLFEYCIEHHHGVVAMGLVADSGIVQTVPICEMESFTNNMGKDLGVFVTLRVVGRAKLIDIFQQEPYIKAICEEIIDTIPPNLEL